MVRIKPKLEYSQKIVAKFRKSARFWASLVCIVGAVVHTGIISLNYLLHPIGANLEMKTINNFALPSVSICFDYLRKGFRYIDHPVHPIKVSTLTVKEINDGLLKWEDLIIFCKVLDVNYNQVDCESLMVQPENINNTNQHPIILEQLSHYLKCFTLFSGFNDTISYDRDKVGDSPLMDIRLNTFNLSLGKRLGLYILSPYEELDESISNPSFIQFDAIDSNQATVTFESIFIYQFQSRFYSNCFPYVSEGYQKYGCGSISACLNQCLFEATYNQTGSTHYRRFIKIKDQYSDARFSLMNDSEFQRKCMARYHPTPCVYHRYTPLLTSQYLSPYRNANVFQISILYPETIDVIIQYGLTQSLIEYLIFLLSTVVLWTELSLNKIISSFLLSAYSCYEQVCIKLTQTSNSLAVKLRLKSDAKTGIKPTSKAKSRTRLGTMFDVKPHARLDTTPDNSTGVNLGIYRSVGGKVTRKKLLSSKRLNNSLLDYY
uniref:Uncharacterized protein n=1 Tax=Tetranychus urticae TaxID=32264 RepID=T1KVN3_TETUR